MPWDPDLLAALPWLVALAPMPPALPGGAAWALGSLAAMGVVASLPPACPDDMVLVDGFFCPALSYRCARPVDRINTYRCAEYARDARCAAPLQLRRFCVDRHEWPNRPGALPRVYVDWFEAGRLCGSVGKRLCRRTEWVFACEGEKRLPYGWGYERQPSPCNVDRAVIDFDIDAMLDPKARDEELARLWQADPIGSHPSCQSSWGAYDMNGNVDEWTDDVADNPGSPHISTLNGAYWGKVRATCRITTTSHGPTFQFYQVGFRCCADAQDGIVTPEPPITVLPRMPAPNLALTTSGLSPWSWSWSWSWSARRGRGRGRSVVVGPSWSTSRGRRRPCRPRQRRLDHDGPTTTTTTTSQVATA